MVTQRIALVLGMALMGVPGFSQQAVLVEGHEQDPAFFDGGIGLFGNLGTAPQHEKAMQVLLGGRTGSFLGVGVREVDSKRAAELKLREERGVEITSVEDESPAQKAGLAKEDVVLEYNGQRVEGIEQFVRLVRETPSGRTAKLLISRGGATQAIAATIANRAASKRPSVAVGMVGGEPLHLWTPDVPRPAVSWRSTVLGVEAEKLEGQFAQFFGVKEGVLVRSVGDGTAAQKAGLKAGDVITKVGDTLVDSPRELSEAMRQARGKKSVALAITRDRKESSLNVALEDRQGEAPAPARGPARSVRNQQF